LLGQKNGRRASIAVSPTPARRKIVRRSGCVGGSLPLYRRPSRKP
jgi:hypothetical protein